MIKRLVHTTWESRNIIYQNSQKQKNNYRMEESKKN